MTRVMTAPPRPGRHSGSDPEEPVTEIDVRAIPPRDRHARIFDAFDVLPHGAELVLVNDHDPRPLLFTFQRTRAGLYDWSPLEQGPGIFRILVGRRAEDRALQQSVSDLLGHDHDRLDALMRTIRHAAERGDPEAAARGFEEFRVGLSRHIRAEDQIVFPELARLSGMSASTGPLAVMDEEHREIERTMEIVAAALAVGAEAPFGELVGLLGEHNAKEEEVLYPEIDQLLDEAGRVRMCQAIEAA